MSPPTSFPRNAAATWTPAPSPSAWQAAGRWRWGGDGAALALEMAEAPFAFSALPYTPWQLEQARHREELPRPVRTVVTVCGAMRGVGGIDSWGSDVEAPYRISGERDLELHFRFRL